MKGKINDITILLITPIPHDNCVFGYVEIKVVMKYQINIAPQIVNI